MKSHTLAVFAISSAAAVMAADSTGKGVPVPSQLPKVGALRSQGCWAAKGATWELLPTLDFPSSGSCGTACSGQNNTVSALRGEECWCGDDYPPEGAYADDQNCNYPCPGFDLEACGGIKSPGYYSVFNTGVKASVPNAPEASSTTGSPISSPTGSSLEITKAPNDDPVLKDTPPEEGSGSNAVGIAVGVVVGLVLLAAAIGVGYFYIRKKKRQEEAEERRRADAINGLVGSGSKPGSISGSFADSRLDPVMARRISDGSIADNQDYSRKILRVTNA